MNRGTPDQRVESHREIADAHLVLDHFDFSSPLFQPEHQEKSVTAERRGIDDALTFLRSHEKPLSRERLGQVVDYVEAATDDQDDREQLTRELELVQWAMDRLNVKPNPYEETPMSNDRSRL